MCIHAGCLRIVSVCLDLGRACVCLCGSACVRSSLPVMWSGLGGNFLVLLSLRNASCCRACSLWAVSAQFSALGVA